MTVSTIKMTARQFLELGEDPPGVRLELVDGEVAVSPSPTPLHSYVVVQLTALFVDYVKAGNRGRVYADVDTIFGEHDVRRPDLLFFAQDRVHLIGSKAMQGPPDLCVEVISPSSRLIDRRDKLAQYAKGGVAFYWIVDPEKKTLEAFRLVNGNYENAGSGANEDVVALPPFVDLQVPMGDLWEPESP